MVSTLFFRLPSVAALVGISALPAMPAPLWELRGVTVTPRLRAETIRYRHAPTPKVGARVQLFRQASGAVAWPSGALIHATLAAPTVWLSAITFPSPTNSAQPDEAVLYVANETGVPQRLTATVRLRRCFLRSYHLVIRG